MAATIAMSKPSLIEWGPVRFLIMDKPKDSNLHLYLKECKKNNVTHIVRICEPCYEKTEVEKAGIQLHVSAHIWQTAVQPCSGDVSRRRRALAHFSMLYPNPSFHPSIQSNTNTNRPLLI